MRSSELIQSQPLTAGTPHEGYFTIALANACLYGIPEQEICYAMDR